MIELARHEFVEVGPVISFTRKNTGRSLTSIKTLPDDMGMGDGFPSVSPSTISIKVADKAFSDKLS